MTATEPSSTELDPIETPTPGAANHARRDGEALLIMGVFFAVLAVAVLVGTAWNEPGKGRVVNVVSGLVLLGIAALAAWTGRHLRRKPTNPTHTADTDPS